MNPEKQIIPVELADMSDEAREKISQALDNSRSQPPEEPMINAYVCKSCGHTTYTVDVADGTAPMMLPCMAHTQSNIVGLDGGKVASCSGQMLSTFYSSPYPDVKLEDVEFEWRYATLPEYRDYKSRGRELADHVASGGLVLHKRKNKSAPVFTHGGFFVRPDGTRLSDEEAASLATGLQTLKEVIRMDVRKAKNSASQKFKSHQKKVAKRRQKRKNNRRRKKK